MQYQLLKSETKFIPTIAGIFEQSISTEITEFETGKSWQLLSDFVEVSAITVLDLNNKSFVIDKRPNCVDMFRRLSQCFNR